MPDGQPAAETSSCGNADAHRSQLKQNAEGLSRSLSEVFAFLTHGTASLEEARKLLSIITNVCPNTLLICFILIKHLLLLLPFILSNLFRDEVDEHNSRNRGAHVVDPSEELVGVVNLFLRWYKHFRQVVQAKMSTDINLLRSLSHRQNIICIMSIMCIMQYLHIIDIFCI